MASDQAHQNFRGALAQLVQEELPGGLGSDEANDAAWAIANRYAPELWAAMQPAEKEPTT